MYILYQPVVEALSENFPSILGAVRPGIPFSKIKPLIKVKNQLKNLTNQQNNIMIYLSPSGKICYTSNHLQFGPR
jgi:hypothetical protein